MKLAKLAKAKLSGSLALVAAAVIATSAFAGDTSSNYVWPGVGTLIFDWLLSLLG
jgi:hypothetical protein